MNKLAETSKPGGKARLEILESGVGIISLGAAEESVITLSKERIESLKDILSALESKTPKAVVIISPRAEMYTAGADLNMAAKVEDPRVGEQLGREGQSLFSRIAALSCYKVAAISGPCLGGGCEMALACDYRIITDHKASVIGLPEVKLGILPGWGGTQRLPRLISLPAALDIILQGKALKPKKALAVGLVNEIVTWEKLKDSAIAVALGNAPRRAITVSLKDKLLTNNPLGRAIVARTAREQVRKTTKGFYPAPPAALECCLQGFNLGMPEGLRMEAKELGRLLTSPECKSLIKLFFMTEAAKALGRAGRKEVEHLHGVVIGAGAMGAGIAGALAKSECPVILKDIKDDFVQRGMNQIKSSLKYMSEVERNLVLSRVELATGNSPNLGNVTFAIEAILEEMPLKKKVLGELAGLIPDDALITTNTSSLSVTEMAEGIKNPERFAGLHFFNPVDKMPLVEIVRGAKTSDKTIAVLAALTVKMGKYPIVVEDVPGFLVNRVLSPYLNEAAFLLQDGYSMTDIDKAALKFGMPMGPVRLLDEVGLDVAAHVADSMVRGYGDRMKAPSFAKALVDAGRKGKKSGAGFYEFKDKEFTPTANIRDILKISAALKTGSDLRPIMDRLVMSLINEAVLALDAGVAGRPGNEAANQVDLGTVMGIGFPPFRGGLLHYADSLGSRAVLDTLKKLEKEHGSRFTPCKGIVARADKNKTFHEAV